MSIPSIKPSQACDPILILNPNKLYQPLLHLHFSIDPYLTYFFSYLPYSSILIPLTTFILHSSSYPISSLSINSFTPFHVH